MDFFEASEIAKRHPGSRITRNEAGSFIVYLSNGSLMKSAPQPTPKPPSEHPTLPTTRNTSMGQPEQLIDSLRIDLDAATEDIDDIRATISKLRTEVKGLRDAIAKIPSTQWSKFEEEKKRLDSLASEQEKAKEKDRLVNLAKSRTLTHEQLVLVVDNATSFGIEGEDLDFILAEEIRTRPNGTDLDINDSLVVHSLPRGSK